MNFTTANDGKLAIDLCVNVFAVDTSVLGLFLSILCSLFCKCCFWTELNSFFTTSLKGFGSKCMNIKGVKLGSVFSVCQPYLLKSELLRAPQKNSCCFRTHLLFLLCRPSVGLQFALFCSNELLFGSLLL